MCGTVLLLLHDGADLRRALGNFIGLDVVRIAAHTPHSDSILTHKPLPPHAVGCTRPLVSASTIPPPTSPHTHPRVFQRAAAPFSNFSYPHLHLF